MEEKKEAPLVAVALESGLFTALPQADEGKDFWSSDPLYVAPYGDADYKLRLSMAISLAKIVNLLNDLVDATETMADR